MTGAELMAAIAFGLTVAGAVFGAFWRMWSLIEEAGAKGEKAQRDLAAHKLYTAEHYATKAGLEQQTSQMLRAIEGVAARIDGLSERLDNILLQRTTRTRG